MSEVTYFIDEIYESGPYFVGTIKRSDDPATFIEVRAVGRPACNNETLAACNAINKAMRAKEPAQSYPDPLILEKIAIMMAKSNGNAIQWRYRGQTDWEDPAMGISWNWEHYDYRIKPQRIEPAQSIKRSSLSDSHIIKGANLLADTFKQAGHEWPLDGGHWEFVATLYDTMRAADLNIQEPAQAGTVAVDREKAKQKMIAEFCSYYGDDCFGSPDHDAFFERLVDAASEPSSGDT